MYCWITEDDYNAHAKIALGEECEPDEATLAETQVAAAQEALAAASAILQVKTGARIHGPGIAIDEFRAWPNARRLKLTHQPGREVILIEHITDYCGTTEVGPESCDWMMFGGAIYFSPTRRGTIYTWTRDYGFPCKQEAALVRVHYSFGSTVSAAARNALLALSRELYLAGPCGNVDECSLPERVISVSREGLSYSLLDPQNFYEKGRLGLPVVDQWLSTLNLSGLRPAGIYGVDAPPGVNVSTECRPEG